MQSHNSPEWMKSRLETLRRKVSTDEGFPGVQETFRGADQSETRRIIDEHLQERAKRETRRKWTGRGLMILGAVTLLGSCPLQVLSLMAFQTMAVEAIVVAVGLIAGGFVLTMIRPRLKDTNEALLVAMKYGNRLTSARLALELDISFDRAEKIIQELVKSGIAEIDLDNNQPDQAITYKIRGF
jgi:hypothetical protein